MVRRHGLRSVRTHGHRGSHVQRLQRTLHLKQHTHQEDTRDGIRQRNATRSPYPFATAGDAGHRHQLRRRTRVAQRQSERGSRRSARADRPERRRQIDHDQDPDRRLSARIGQRALRRPRSRFPHAEAGARSRHQHDLSGDQPGAVPLGGGEHFPRPRATPFRPDRLARGAATRRRPARLVRLADRCEETGQPLFDRDPADGGPRARRFVGCEDGHHGRVHLVAR
jgi:hypothetical protein